MKIKELLKHNKYKACPYCKKQIRKNALRCKWCGRWQRLETDKLNQV